MMPLRFIGVGPSGRFAEPLAGVALRGDLAAPCPVRDEPVDGLGEARLERLGGAPPELASNLRAVDRVPAVVPGPVLHELDLRGVGLAILAGGAGVEERADEL